jgi:hypothetical protein
MIDKIDPLKIILFSFFPGIRPGLEIGALTDLSNSFSAYNLKFLLEKVLNA